MVAAARLIRHGAALQVEDVELPEPAADEVRVELAYAGVNPVDRYVAEGRLGADAPLPRTLGGEAAGRLDGEPVLVSGSGLGSARDGVWAAAAVVPGTAVVPVPRGVGLLEAAATGVAGLTAWNVLHLAEVGPEDRVLVLGASGGVGLPTVSLAASLGATVWGQTGRADTEAVLREQGARNVVVCDAAGLGAAVAPLQPTVVIDPLGGPFTPAALAALSGHGRHVIFGTSAGPEAEVDLSQLYRKGLHVLGYGGLQLTDEQRRRGLELALEALADGRMRLPIGRTVALGEVNGALQLLSDHSITGKIMLACS